MTWTFYFSSDHLSTELYGHLITSELSLIVWIYFFPNGWITTCWENIWWIHNTYSLYERICIDTHHILTSPLWWGHTHTYIEEDMSHTFNDPQAIVWYTSCLPPLHLIEDKGMYTTCYSTVVDYITIDRGSVSRPFGTQRLTLSLVSHSSGLWSRSARPVNRF